MKELKNIIEIIKPIEIKGELSDNILGLTDDTREMKENYLFFAIKGVSRDGHDFLKSIKNFPCVAVVERFVEDTKLTQIKVLSTKKAFFDALIYWNGVNLKDLTFIGVTGTNGKTTFTYLIESIYKESKKKIGVIGTVNYRCHDLVINASHTTPDIKNLCSLFKTFQDRGCEVIVMEVSSHALEQNRLGALKFDATLFTNLTAEHLDYHKNMEDYFNAKKMLFFNHLKDNGIAIINVDDNYGEKLYEELKDKKIKGFSFNKKTDYACAILKMDNKGLDVGIWTKNFSDVISSSLKGKFNAYNIVGAYIVALELGLSSEDIKEGIKALKKVPGRLEEVPNACGLNVFIDYAHTPDALENVLKTIRDFSKGRIITVFGCGGDRDKSKRAPMGKIASTLSDITIITSDNPRSEDPLGIIEDIKKGVSPNRRLFIQPDREKAIKDAIFSSRKGDTILIAGKGHENYQILGDKTIHFSDFEVAKKVLELRECLVQEMN